MVDAEVIEVGPGGDYMSVTAALATLDADSQAVLRVDGIDTVVGDVLVTGTVAILAISDTPPLWEGGLPLSVNGYVFIENFVLESANVAIENSGLLWLDRTFVHGEIRSQGSLHFRNSISVPGMLLWDSEDSEVLDSTVIGQTGIFCVIGNRDVTIRNSLIINTSPVAQDVDLCNATITTSAFGSYDAGPGNVVVGPVDPNWFIDYDTFDLHLSAAAPIELTTLGVWLDGDPIVDFDLDPRPAVNGAADAIGADVP